MITLEQALRLQNHKGKGVNVCFCSSEEDDFEKVGFASARTFSEIRDTPGKGMCKNPEYIEYLERCIKWRMEHEE